MNESATPFKKTPSPGIFWLSSILVGIVAGLGAVAFRGLIGGIHNLFFLGKLSFAYNANLHTPSSPWGAWIILAPIIGAAVVAFLVKTFAPEAKGHGVPEVMDAVYFHEGKIRPVVALIKALASAISIGTGGSVGREGPIVQIGSSFGSTLGQFLHLSARQRITLIAAGAGGGIAATFNTPIGGILFAVELLLTEISARTLIPVAISTATATYISRLMLSANPSFSIPNFESYNFHSTNPLVLLACVGLGILLGFVATGFTQSVYWVEDFFDQKLFRNYYIRHLLGMSVVGLLIWLTQKAFGHYYIEGVGYATVQDVLSGSSHLTLLFLLLLFVLKIVVTSITLGSGGSGGIFSPSLFLGATFGAAYGLLLNVLFPHLPISPAAFAVVGMAGVVGSGTGAAITSIVMIFEMTLDYQMILPMTIAVAISYGIRKFMMNDSIYSLKLSRRGLPVPGSLEVNTWLVRQARNYMDRRFVAVPMEASRELLKQVLTDQSPHWFLIEEEGKIVGVLDALAVSHFINDKGDSSLKEVALPKFDVIDERTVVFEFASRMRVERLDGFLVMSNGGTRSVASMKGVLSKQRITEILFDSVAVNSH